MSDDSCSPEMLAALVNGQIPGDADATFWRAALQAARSHGLVTLIHEALRARHWSRLPEAARLAWWKAASDASAASLRRDLHLRKTLALLAEAGVAPLVLKGAALAQSHYASPGLRPRADNDLWVSEGDRAALDRTLRASGLEVSVGIDGDLLAHQRSYIAYSGEARLAHVYDVHWRISNRQAVIRSGVFDFDRCATRAQPVAALGPSARALADEDALLFACVHLVAHHAHEERLIWLYDIRLLVEAMGEQRFASFAARAEGSGFGPVCRDAIQRAARLFGVRNPAAAAWLEAAEQADTPTSRPIDLAYATRSEVLWSDLRALPGWSERASFLLQNLWPSRDYMMRRYAIDRRWKLPYYRVKRLVSGLEKLRRAP